MRIAVIGAGLGGLCLAQGLRQAGLDVAVYERDPGITARFQGHRIGLGEVGMTALRGCLPERWHALLDAVIGDLAGERLLFDSQLNPTGQWPALTATATDRHVLRHLLLAGLEDRVHTGKELIGYETLEDGRVRATFADGTTTTSDVLIGADGIGSAVRRVLAPEVTPEDIGVRIAIGRTPLTDRFARLVPGFGTMIQGPDVMLALGLMRFREQPKAAAARLAPEVELPDTTDYVRWAIILPPGHPAGGAVDTALSLTADWHEDVRALIDAADTDNSTVISIRVVRPGARWPSGPVTLLGDAIHATSPSGGNGANVALCDADLLRQAIVALAEGRSTLTEALDEYERQMFKYGTEAVEHSVAALDKFSPAKR